MATCALGFFYEETVRVWYVYGSQLPPGVDNSGVACERGAVEPDGVCGRARTAPRTRELGPRSLSAHVSADVSR